MRVTDRMLARIMTPVQREVVLRDHGPAPPAALQTYSSVNHARCTRGLSVNRARQTWGKKRLERAEHEHYPLQDGSPVLNQQALAPLPLHDLSRSPQPQTAGRSRDSLLPRDCPWSRPPSSAPLQVHGIMCSVKFWRSHADARRLSQHFNTTRNGGDSNRMRQSVRVHG